AMNLDGLRKKLKVSGGKSSSAARAASSPPEAKEIYVEAMTKRHVGCAVLEQASIARLGKQVKIAVKKHKSHHGEGSSQATARGKELTTLTEGDVSPTYRRPKSMKDLCDTRVRDRGYYVLQIADSAPKDLDASILQAVDRVWMGATSDGSGVLEYRYRVALARFKARYPDLEVDSDPFTEKPEDNLVPMETRQEFDDSVPAKE
ncbi:hypothetical protein GW17_00061853, partial [Ensete ventricosum]